MKLNQHCRHNIKYADAAGTRANHRTHYAAYLRFCKEYMFRPFPADEWRYCQFAQFLSAEHKEFGTIQNYCSSVRTLHRLQGLPVPETDQIHYSKTIQCFKKARKTLVKQATPMTRPGSRGSATSTQSGDSSVQLVSFHQNILGSAQIPPDEVLWVNQKGETRPRKVVGDKVWIRQQPPGPPPEPEILVLTDQLLEKAQSNDKYIKTMVMIGYTLQDYTNDIRGSAIDVKFPYVLVFLGLLQLGAFDSRVVHKQVSEFVNIITQITPNSLIVFSGLVLRLLYFPSSKNRCENYSRAYQSATQELSSQHASNCTYVSVFREFLDKSGRILQPDTNFQDGIYLTQTGIRKLRSVWLRFLGYFPKK